MGTVNLLKQGLVLNLNDNTLAFNSPPLHYPHPPTHATPAARPVHASTSLPPSLHQICSRCPRSHRVPKFAPTSVRPLNSRVKLRNCLPFIFVAAECTYENSLIRLGVFMFVALFNGSGYALMTAASPGATAPSRQQLSVMYALTLMCEDAGGNLQSIHAKEGCVMHRELHDGFRLVAACEGNGTDEHVCQAVLSAVSRAFTALSPCIPWASAGMQRASVPSEHKAVVEWLCRSVRAMLTPSGLLSIVSLAPLVIVLSLKCTEFAICGAVAATSLRLRRPAGRLHLRFKFRRYARPSGGGPDGCHILGLYFCAAAPGDDP